MARKKDSGFAGCFVILMAIVLINWILSNVIVVIGFLLIAISIYLRHYKKMIPTMVFWIIFLVGVVLVAYHFT